jgi:hypothetical protein
LGVTILPNSPNSLAEADVVPGRLVRMRVFIEFATDYVAVQLKPRSLDVKGEKAKRILPR